jgi:hypothetical protein
MERVHTCQMQGPADDGVSLRHLGASGMTSENDLLHIREVDGIREPLDDLVQCFI